MALLAPALALLPCLQQLWAPARCPHGAQRPHPRALGTSLVLILRRERKSRPAAPLAQRWALRKEAHP